MSKKPAPSIDDVLAEFMHREAAGKPVGPRLLARAAVVLERERKAREPMPERTTEPPTASPALRRLRLHRGRAEAAQKRLDAGRLALAEVAAGMRPSWDLEALRARGDYSVLTMRRDQNERDALAAEQAVLATGEHVEPWTGGTLEPTGGPMNETEIQAARNRLADLRCDVDALEALLTPHARLQESVAGRIRDAAWSVETALYQVRKVCR